MHLWLVSLRGTSGQQFQLSRLGYHPHDSRIAAGIVLGCAGRRQHVGLLHHASRYFLRYHAQA
jgi:hypothetical protein